jgi:hypothetical protein
MPPNAERRAWSMTRSVWFAIIAGVLIVAIVSGASIWWIAAPSSCWRPGAARNVGIAEICP